ncbi:hypothetical protein [Haloglycomyces albus]|uniref:hypothetical protein n=1 Tax=Haloglycomyces albus TaxID=526067 RepID=UPI00046D8E9F|nr:hypothetical protein [Haloglycomyces albus]
MVALATLAQLEARLGRPIPEGPEQDQAIAALDDASALVLSYGRPTWSTDTVPAVVRVVVLAVAERRVRNPDGMASEQAGEYSYRLSRDTPAGVALTDTEAHVIRRAAGHVGLTSVRVNRAVAPHSQTWGVAR